MDPAQRMQFSKSMLGYTKSGTPYFHRTLQLPWEDDFCNVIIPYEKGLIVFGTEQGRIGLLRLAQETPPSLLMTDKQISSIEYYPGFVWSSGQNRKVICQKLSSKQIVFSLSEIRQPQQYSDQGIRLTKCFKRDFLIFNCGGLKFKILHQRSKKVVLHFDLAKYLSNNLDFQEFDAADTVAWRFSVGKVSPTVFIAINRYHPHFIIFDFLKRAISKFICIFPRIDWHTGSVVPMLGMHILASNLDDFVVFVTQIRNQDTKKIHTFFRVLQNEKNSPSFKVYDLREVSGNET